MEGGIHDSVGRGSEVRLLGLNDTDTVVVPAGVRCIFDGFIYPGGAQDSGRVFIVVRDADANPILGPNVDPGLGKSQRKGSTNNIDTNSGRSGVESRNGLRIIKPKTTLGNIVAVLYRISPLP